MIANGTPRRRCRRSGNHPAADLLGIATARTLVCRTCSPVLHDRADAGTGRVSKGLRSAEWVRDKIRHLKQNAACRGRGRVQIVRVRRCRDQISVMIWRLASAISSAILARIVAASALSPRSAATLRNTSSSPASAKSEAMTSLA